MTHAISGALTEGWAPMTRPTSIDTLDDLKAWAHDHDGRNDAYWEAQHHWNDKLEVNCKEHEVSCAQAMDKYTLMQGRKMDTMATRITSIEKKSMWVSGACAAIGSIVGVLLSGGLQAKGL